MSHEARAMMETPDGRRMLPALEAYYGWLHYGWRPANQWAELVIETMANGVRTWCADTEPVAFVEVE